MATDSGYSNQKKKGTSQFETVQNLGSSNYGKAVQAKGLYEITVPANIPSVSEIIGSDGQVQYWNLEYPSHGAAVGNILRMTSGNLINFEFEIMAVPDADHIYVLPIASEIPQAGDDATVLGWVTQKLGSDGGIAISVAGLATEAKQDQQIVLETSMDSNIASLEAKDFATEATLLSLNGKIPSSLTVTSTRLLVDGSGVTQPVSASSLPLPTGASTEATLLSLNGKIPSNLTVTSTRLLVDPSGVTSPISAASLPLPSGAATAANQSSELTLIGAVTEAAPASDTASSGLNGRLQRIAQRITSLIALLPTSLGQKTMANSLAVVVASDQSTLTVAQAVQTASFQEITNLTTVAQTFTPTTNAKNVVIYADYNNTANIRVRLAGTATTTSGISFEPGRSEVFPVAGTAISVIAESGTNQKINVTFGV